jgi:hypothetical protein
MTNLGDLVQYEMNSGKLACMSTARDFGMTASNLFVFSDAGPILLRRAKKHNLYDPTSHSATGTLKHSTTTNKNNNHIVLRNTKTLVSFTLQEFILVVCVMRANYQDIRLSHRQAGNLNTI